jgi:hypothetical protein
MIDFSSPILWIVIVGLILIIIGIALAFRTIRCGELPPMNRKQLIWNVDNIMRSRRWNSAADYSKGKITVSRDSLVAADVYFKKLPSGNIEVRTGVNAGTLGWILTILFVFMTVIGGLIMGLALHFMSRGFAKKVVVPLIFHYHKTHGLNRKMPAFRDPYPGYTHSILPRYL